MKAYLKWASREHSLGKRIAFLAPLGPFFLLLLPYLLVLAGKALDRRFGLPGFAAAPSTHIAAVLLAAAGAFLAFWSINSQMTIGRGTPVPLMPTQQLIAGGPFALCRNPMTLGTILLYLGAAVWLGSLATLGVVLAFGALLLAYIKCFEEKELAARFGDAYQEYKRRTPFLLPRLRRR